MKTKRIIRIIIAISVIGAVGAAVANRQHINQESVGALLEDLGLWAHALYLLLWLIVPVLMLPGSALTVVAGAFFGPVLGTVYTSLASTVGATLAFLLSRYLAGDWAERMAGGYLAKIKTGVEMEGWRFVAFTRLVPLFPFNLLNYAFGLTRISLPAYLIASWIFMLPGTAGYVYIGYAAKETAVGGEDAVRKGLLAVAVLAALIFLPLMLRRMRARVARKSSGEGAQG